MVAAATEEMGRSGEGVMYIFILARIQHVMLDAMSTQCLHSLNLVMFACIYLNIEQKTLKVLHAVQKE